MVRIYRQRPVARRRCLGEALGGDQEAGPPRPRIGVVGTGNALHIGAAPTSRPVKGGVRAGALAPDAPVPRGGCEHLLIAGDRLFISLELKQRVAKVAPGA